MTGRLWYFTTRIFFYRLFTIVAKFSTFFSCADVLGSIHILLGQSPLQLNQWPAGMRGRRFYLNFIYSLIILRPLNGISPPPHALVHSPPSPKTSGTLSSFVSSPTAMPPATQIFPSVGGIPSLNKGLLDERATILSHSVTSSRNILWGFLYSGLILEDPRGGGYCYSYM